MANNIDFSSTEEMISAVEYSRILREKFITDPYRPKYHFACPGDNGIPGDANGAFFANGRYHLMYLYQCRSDNFRWGHMSSIDMVHWTHHPDALMPDELDGGIFSGGAFVDDDGTVYLTYWALPAFGNNGGIRVAYSKDINNHYEKWTKVSEYAVTGSEFGFTEDTDENGRKFYRGSADPSNIWKKGDKYYLEAGNLPVLNLFRDKPDASKNNLGDWTDLYSTDDPKSGNWKYEHRFYSRHENNEWTDESEDDMCPSFYPLPYSRNGKELSDKYIQTFIAHNRGTQYYIGKYDKENDIFIPEQHGRMSWMDNTFFAPENVMTPDGRQVVFAWLLDNMEDELNKFGWSGVYALPRELWLNEKGTLGISPIRELSQLEYNNRNGVASLNLVDKKSCKVTVKARINQGGKVGLRLFASDDGHKYASVFYDDGIGYLVMDETNAEKINRAMPGVTPWIDPDNKIFPSAEYAPFTLEDGEELEMTVYIDGPVADIFVNDRQAIIRRICTDNPAQRRNISILCENAEILSVETADMMPSNMF